MMGAGWLACGSRGQLAANGWRVPPGLGTSWALKSPSVECAIAFWEAGAWLVAPAAHVRSTSSSPATCLLQARPSKPSSPCSEALRTACNRRCFGLHKGVLGSGSVRDLVTRSG